MIKLMAWITRIGIWVLALMPIAVVSRLMPRVGPDLRAIFMFGGLAIVACCASAYYYAVKGQAIPASWRSLYIAAAIAVGLAAYINTGDVWFKDRVSLSIERDHEERESLADVSRVADPTLHMLRVARAQRNATIAKAEEEYGSLVARLSGRNTPLPRAVTLWLWLAALLLIFIAFQPVHRIRQSFSQIGRGAE